METGSEPGEGYELGIFEVVVVVALVGEDGVSDAASDADAESSAQV